MQVFVLLILLKELFELDALCFFCIKHCFLNLEKLASATSLDLSDHLAAYALKKF